MDLFRNPAAKSQRLEALSDGVFAIVMTLLVFEVNLPPLGPEASEALLKQRLLQLGPTLFSYIVSFIILGIYWIGHRNQFGYIERVDLTITWLNLFFLMFVGLVPFSASLIGEYPGEALAAMVYGANLAAISIFHLLTWYYATHNSRLVDKDFPSDVIHLGLAISIAPLAAYLLAIILAIFNTTLSLMVFALVPLPFVAGLAYRIRHKREG